MYYFEAISVQNRSITSDMKTTILWHKYYSSLKELG